MYVNGVKSNWFCSDFYGMLKWLNWVVMRYIFWFLICSTYIGDDLICVCGIIEFGVNIVCVKDL